MAFGKEFLIGLTLLLIGYVLGLATDIVKHYLSLRARLVILSYGAGQHIDDIEDNTLIIGNIGKAPCNNVLVTFDYAGFVAKDGFIIRSRTDYEMKSDTAIARDGQPRDAVAAVHFHHILPGQTVVMKYNERYSIGGNPLARGFFPTWHVLSPSSTTENLAKRARLARKLFDTVRQQYPYDFNDEKYPAFRPTELL